MVSLQMVCIEIIAVNIAEDVSPGSINKHLTPIMIF
jgi:hypothetical protein